MALLLNQSYKLPFACESNHKLLYYFIKNSINVTTGIAFDEYPIKYFFKNYNVSGFNLSNIYLSSI
jgi:hypothetical protein